MKKILIGKIKFLAVLSALLLALYVIGVGCPIRRITGASCPGCGMTRAVLSLLRFHFHDAIAFHPLVILMPIALPFFLFYEKIPRRLAKILLWLAIATFFAVYIIRLLWENGDVVNIDFHESLLYIIFRRLFL
ncbi:MAG: DUF2752 domain-containing protein [Oscillospiraceae bacterium]